MLNDGIRPSAWVRKFPIDGGLLLLDVNSNSLFAYNDTARFAWELIEASRPVADLEAEFAEAWGIPLPRAQADLESILAQWRTHRLIGGAEKPPATAKIGLAAPANRYPAAPAGWASEWICTIGGVVIAFAMETDVPSVRLFLSKSGNPRQAAADEDRDQRKLVDRGCPRP